MSTEIKRAIISGGGTGGHIFPALAIAAAIKKQHPQADILFVGAIGRMEMDRVPAAGYRIVGLPIAGFDRKRLWRNFSVLLKIWRSMRIATKLIREYQPQIAIGVGGYASGPLLKAAQKAGIPTLLQEQNSYAGVTNKLLAPKAQAICVAYSGMERFFPAEKIIMTGNPIRQALLSCPLTPPEAKKALGFDPDKPLVLVVGGSLGARTINQAIARSVDTLIAVGAQVLWQTGRNGEEIAANACSDPSIRHTTFISDMATAYRAADIVVSRAGAGTISELQALAKPTILIPSPNVAEDHQRHNAEALSNVSAALMILDKDAEEQLPNTLIGLLGDADKQKSLSDNIRKLALMDSDVKIAQIAQNLIANHNKV